MANNGGRSLTEDGSSRQKLPVDNGAGKKEEFVFLVTLFCDIGLAGKKEDFFFWSACNNGRY